MPSSEPGWKNAETSFTGAGASGVAAHPAAVVTAARMSVGKRCFIECWLVWILICVCRSIVSWLLRESPFSRRKRPYGVKELSGWFLLVHTAKIMKKIENQFIPHD